VSADDSEGKEKNIMRGGKKKTIRDFLQKGRKKRSEHIYKTSGTTKERFSKRKKHPEAPLEGAATCQLDVKSNISLAGGGIQ